MHSFEKSRQIETLQQRQGPQWNWPLRKSINGVRDIYFLYVPFFVFKDFFLPYCCSYLISVIGPALLIVMMLMKIQLTVLALSSLICSSSTVSRFFSTNPSIWYSTRSAKWTTTNEVWESRGFSKCFDLPACMSHTLWHQLLSDAFGICHNNHNITNKHILPNSLTCTMYILTLRQIVTTTVFIRTT